MSLQALELLDEAERIATIPETIAEAAVTRIVLSLTTGSPVQSSGEIERISRALSKRAEDVDRRIKVLWGAAINARGRGLPQEEWRKIEAELETITTTNPLKYVALAALSPLGRVASLRKELPALVPQLADFPLGMISLAIAAESLQDLETSLTCWGLAYELFHDGGGPADETQALRGRANVQLLRGRIQEGLADAEYAARMIRDTGQPLLGSMVEATAARAHALLGDDDSAARSILASHELAKRGRLALASADTRWAAGMVALGQHRYRDASIEFTHMTIHPTRALWAIADRTEAAVRAGRGDTVRDNVLQAESAAKAYRSSYLTALVARSQALLSKGDEAEINYQAAIHAGQLSESPLELARTRLVYGEWLRRERRVVDARVQLSDALREFDVVGARVFAERAASELRAAGQTPLRPSTPAISGVLTPQELQVAKLASEGMSNKQIADRVYLSHRTVSTHLYKLFPKLGITGRGQVAAALLAAGY